MARKAVERTYYANDVIEDRGAGTIQYRTGFSLATWRGQFDWGERKRLAKRVLDGVGQRVSV